MYRHTHKQADRSDVFISSAELTAVLTPSLPQPEKKKKKKKKSGLKFAHVYTPEDSIFDSPTTKIYLEYCAL